ncbi:PP2C family protein-serine/threonine phosphatase [Roseovarius salinarum]|uniref:PP2C family protein-serine/threonine phosphatase n=1 Tax=Roseovarius salinarum TaxID=1981892 RepID=UPI000C339E44|nr:SpoIIE family protein phosphatase [Roseovarius salinarum]
MQEADGQLPDKPNPAETTLVGGDVIRRVLVLDDSRLQRRILAASLERWGFEILEADSGRAALDLCRERPPDLVLSDWMMPGMDGVAFCREFRRMPRESYGYFILLTSKSDKDDIAHGLDAGADDFLTKPVNPGELRARISAGARILRMERELTEKNRLLGSTLGELQTVYGSLKTDLVEARKLQQSLVSERYRDFGRAEVALMLQSSGDVGGDLVGFFPIGERRIGLFGIDVSGHGISSALLTARLSGFLSSAVPEQNVALKRLSSGLFVPRPPAEVTRELNQLFLDELRTELYFTLLLADVDLVTGRVCMAQAGHPHPLVLRAGGQVESVGPGGLPVGLVDGARYDHFEVCLNSGDALLIHSDGLTDCTDPQGRQMGEAGLERLVGSLAGLPPRQFLDTLLWQIADFAGGRDMPDDASAALLAFR